MKKKCENLRSIETREKKRERRAAARRSLGGRMSSMSLFASPQIASPRIGTAARQRREGILRDGNLKCRLFFNHSATSAPGKARRIGAGGGGMTYRDAGVDIEAGAELVRRIQGLNPDIGGFGGLFPLGENFVSMIERRAPNATPDARCPVS